MGKSSRIAEAPSRMAFRTWSHCHGDSNLAAETLINNRRNAIRGVFFSTARIQRHSTVDEQLDYEKNSSCRDQSGKRI